MAVRISCLRLCTCWGVVQRQLFTSRGLLGETLPVCGWKPTRTLSAGGKSPFTGRWRPIVGQGVSRGYVSSSVEEGNGSKLPSGSHDSLTCASDIDTDDTSSSSDSESDLSSSDEDLPADTSDTTDAIDTTDSRDTTNASDVTRLSTSPPQRSSAVPGENEASQTVNLSDFPRSENDGIRTHSEDHMTDTPKHSPEEHPYRQGRYDLHSLLHNIQRSRAEKSSRVVGGERTSMMEIEELVEFLRQQNARDVVVIELPPDLDYVKYFVVCSGVGTRHIGRIADSLVAEVR